MGPVHRLQDRGRTKDLHRCLLLGTGLLVLLLPQTGCARRASVHAENREIRLTQGGLTLRPIFSPDGDQIAYSIKEKGVPPRFRVCVVPSVGGEARTVYSDSAATYAVSWSPEGKSLYVFMEKGDYTVHRMDLEGRILESFPRPNLSRYIAVSPDGRRCLLAMFNRDNYDLAVHALGDSATPVPLAATPAWEVGGCFGPGPEDVTVVSRTVYGAETNEFFIWSAASREFKPLPLPKAKNDVPAWSLDGRYLAYATDLAGQADIWVLDTEEGRSIEITDGPEDETRPDWSPDGESLAFLRMVKASHIYVADPETRDKRQLTRGPDLDIEPLVSPDGEWVAFMRSKPRRTGESSTVLACVPAEGGEVQEFDFGGLLFNSSGGYCWSPDARELAFAADDGTGNVDIYRVPREGGVPVRVTVTPGVDVIPSWSRDGAMLSYTRPAGGETQVWMIPATGGVPEQVTFEDGVNQVSYWSPDGRRLAYLRVLGDGTFEVKVVVPGSRTPLTVLSNDVSVIPTGWSSDGSHVLAWRLKGDEELVVAVAADGSGSLVVGEYEPEPDEIGYFLRFRDEGRRFADVIYPGGVHVFPYGDSSSDLVVRHVGEFLRSGVSRSTSAEDSR